MRSTDKHAKEIAALLVKSKILEPNQQLRAEALLMVSLEERFGESNEQEITLENREDELTKIA